MSMEIGIEHNVKEAVRLMSVKQNKQVPFAASMAINFTADDVAQEVTRQMSKYLDRPTPFTEKAFVSKVGKFKGKRATKRNLEAVIIPGAAQADYLHYQVFGGTRYPKKQKIAVPTANAKLNKYGNIASRRNGLLKNDNQFIATIKGVTGIWERGHYSKAGKFTTKGTSRATAIKLIHVFQDDVSYKPLFPMFKIASRTVNKRFGKNFDKAMKIAMVTAR